MATFIKEDNSNIQSKPVLKLNKKQKQELVRNGMSMLNPESMAYKTIGRFIDPSYNKKNKGAKTAGLKNDEIALGDAKKIVSTYDNIGKIDPNDPSYKAMEPILDTLRDNIKKTRAKYSKQPQAPKPPSVKNLKPKTKTPNTEVKPVKPNSLNESYDHEYYDYMEEYSPREIFEMYKNGDTVWTGLINPESYHQALREFTKYGELVRFPKQKIYQWFGTIMRNTAILDSITSIAGHNQGTPIEDFLDEFFYNYDEGDIDYNAWENYKEEIGYDDDYGAMIEYLDNLNPPFFEWCQMPDGSDPWSDFGIRPLVEIINEYNENKTPEEVLVLLNRALDVAHCRGDLASIFIVGGKKSLTRISEEIKKTNNKQLNEKKYYINTDIETDKNYIYPVKISVDEFEKILGNIYVKHANEHDYDNKPTIKNFIRKYCGYQSETENCKELEKLAKDLDTVQADGENHDMIGKIRTIKNGIPYVIVRKGGDWEIPVLFMLYYDGENVRAYFPKKGNSINLDKMRAFDPLSGSKNGDIEYIKKYYPNEKDIQKILDSIYYDENLCIKDFEDHIKTNRKKLTESKRTIILTEDQLTRLKSTLLKEYYKSDLYHSTTLAHLWSILKDNCIYKNEDCDDVHGVKGEFVSLSRTGNPKLCFKKTSIPCIIAMDAEELMDRSRNGKLKPYNFFHNDKNVDKHKHFEFEERFYGDIKNLSGLVKSIDIYIKDINDCDYDYCDECEEAYSDLQKQGIKEPSDKDINMWFLNHIMNDFPLFKDIIHIHGKFTENKKKTIIISENQLLSLQDLLNEGRNADKAKAKTLEVIRNFFNNASWLDNEFQDEAANPNHLSVIDYIENKLKEICFHANIPDSIIRLEPIIMNIALGLGFEQGSIEDTQKLNRLFKIVESIKNGQQKGILPIQLNKLTLENTTYDSLNEVFGKVIDDEQTAEQERINNADYSQGMNPNYQILSNVDYKTAHKYGEYSCSGSKLCYTQSESTWDQYTKDGENTVYIILRKDWQEVPEKHGENTPYDDYGLSMIFLFIDGNGDLVYSNTRWNHDTRGQGPRNVDQSFTKEQISQLLNVNFNQIFKPSNSWEEYIKTTLEKLKNGEDINNVFEKYIMLNNCTAVRLKHKWNIIDSNANLLYPNQWFDEMHDPTENIVRVELNSKINYINENGRLISSQWFDDGRNFVNGFARIELIDQGGYNWIDKNGKILCPNKFFLACGSFKNGFAPFDDIDDGANYMTTEGKILVPDMYFSDCNHFMGDYGKVEYGQKFNFVNTKGELLLKQWLDDVSTQREESAKVLYNGKDYMLNLKTKLGMLLPPLHFPTRLHAYDEGMYFEYDLIINFDNDKWNYSANNTLLFPNTWFDSVKAFKEYDSQRTKEIDAEIARLEYMLYNEVRNNRDYDYCVNKITELKQEKETSTNWMSLVTLNGHTYFLDLKGNLYNELNEKVGEIPSFFK